MNSSPVPALDVTVATSADASSVSHLLKTVLAGLPYYNSRAVHSELAKFTAAQLRAWITEDPGAVLVAKHESDLVGFCINRLDDDLVWLEWFGVAPNHRRQGVGSALLTCLDHSARDRGAHKIWCDSRTENVGSIEILKRHGYQQLCILTNHWYGQDFILWEKPLSFCGP